MDIAAIELDCALAYRHDPGNRKIERRFSSPIRAEYGDDITGTDDKVDATQNLDLAVAGVQPTNMQQRLSGHARLRRVWPQRPRRGKPRSLSDRRRPLRSEERRVGKECRS